MPVWGGGRGGAGGGVGKGVRLASGLPFGIFEGPHISSLSGVPLEGSGRPHSCSSLENNRQANKSDKRVT